VIAAQGSSPHARIYPSRLAHHPEIGALPPAAQWAFSEFGLTAFGAVVGLLAGPAAFAAMKEQGLALLLSGAVVTILPPLVALYFGRYVLRLHPMILFGALAAGRSVRGHRWPCGAPDPVQHRPNLRGAAISPDSRAS
jgi:hypothetical protein